MQKLKMVWFSVLLGIFSVSLAQESDFDEWLELDLSDLMNIKVTTATKKKQLINKVPATVRIVTADQIKERAYHNLEDVLQDLPGFQFRNIQSFNSYSFLRGAPSQNNLILVLVDGIQINELNSGGFYGGYQYNLQNIKQIEVVYGPSSALYGTNAISGIINIITKDAEEPTAGEVSITGGSFNTFFSDGIYQYHPENTELHASVAAFYKQTDKADLGGAAGDWNWSEDMENYEHDFGLDSKVQYKNTNFGLTLQDKHASRTTYYKSIGTDTLDRGTDWHIRFFNAYLNNVYNKKPNWSLKSQLYYRNSTVMDNTITLVSAAKGIGQVGYYRPNWLLGLEEQFDYSITDKINLITGLVLEREKLAKGFSVTKSGNPDSAPARPPAPGFKINTLISLYSQAQIELIKYTELTAGIRLDHSSYYGDVTTPRLGIVYSHNSYSAKLLYTEAFRAPKPWDYNWGNGNSELQPERMKSVELANLFSLSKYLKFDFSVYQNQIYKILAQTDSCWINADKMNTTGFETSIEYSRKKTELYVNYTYTDSKYSDGSLVPEIAHNSLNAGLCYSILKNLKINLRGNYLGRRKNPFHNTTQGIYYIDPYFVLNAVINYNPTDKIELQMSVNNILNERYYHTSNLSPVRYRQPQRAYYIKIGYQF
jgi:outer membrane cobalamin receptor